MYWLDRQKHKEPHFHARYGGQEVVCALDGRVLDGSIGRRGERLIADWAGERRAELLECWRHAIAGEEIPWVPPLQ